MNLIELTKDLRSAHDRGALRRFGVVNRNPSTGALFIETAMTREALRKAVESERPDKSSSGGPELTDCEIRLFMSCVEDALNPQKRRAGETELGYQWRTHGGC